MSRLPPLRLNAVAIAIAMCALVAGTSPGRAAGPTTFGIAPSRGGAHTGITATFSFKTASALECTGQQVRFTWDDASWTSASPVYIGANGTCTANATAPPPSTAAPGVHRVMAADSSGVDRSPPALYLLLNPDGSAPSPTPAPAAVQPSTVTTGDTGFPTIPVAVIVVLAAIAVAAALLGRRRRPRRP